MQGLQKRILDHAAALPEATPLRPADFLHLGSRTAVYRALSRLTRDGEFMRIYRGIYMRRVPTPSGPISPCTDKAIDELARMWGETIVPHGGAAANGLRLSLHVPVRMVYSTSGPDRRLNFGKLRVDLLHAPRWQLVAPHRMAGLVVRALAWLGPDEVEESLEAVLPKLSNEDRKELADCQTMLPAWMAEPIGARLAYR